MSDSVYGQTVLTLQDMYAAAYRARSPVPLLIVAGLLIAALAHSFLFDPPGAALTTFVIAAAIVIAVLGLWLAVVAFFFRRLSDAQRRLTYEIDRERVALRDESGAATIVPWSQVRLCREHAAGFALFVRPAGARWLVKRAFADADARAFRALARSILGKTARLRE